MSIESAVIEIKKILEIEFYVIADGLRPSVSVEDEDSLRRALHANFPAELSELLRLHDGENQHSSCNLFDGAWLLPAKTILDDYRSHVREASLRASLDPTLSENFETEGNVHPSRWRAGWVPFLEVGKAPWAIDLEPATGGVRGQIISVEIEDGRIRVEADSLESLVLSYRDSLLAGERDFLKAFGR